MGVDWPLTGDIGWTSGGVGLLFPQKLGLVPGRKMILPPGFSGGQFLCRLQDPGGMAGLYALLVTSDPRSGPFGPERESESQI